MKIKYIKYTELKIRISNEISMSFIRAKSYGKEIRVKPNY